jgi:hypothetical protein
VPVKCGPGQTLRLSASVRRPASSNSSRTERRHSVRLGELLHDFWAECSSEVFPEVSPWKGVLRARHARSRLRNVGTVNVDAHPCVGRRLPIADPLLVPRVGGFQRLGRLSLGGAWRAAGLVRMGGVAPIRPSGYWSRSVRLPPSEGLTRPGQRWLALERFSDRRTWRTRPRSRCRCRKFRSRSGS